ncbi:MAG: hypothetical protein IKC87_04665 [Clostridia bacterium]|nr:hypothetical protein [Clostridia bacterium]
MNKAKKIAEWIIIGLFIAIVASVASIQIYRSVVNSDWYVEKQDRKSLEQKIESVNDVVNIKYIKVDDNIEERFIYDAPAELFDDITVISYEANMNSEKWREIFKNPMVTVFFVEGSPISFNISNDGKVYSGAFKLRCPSLVDWYEGIVSANG